MVIPQIRLWIEYALIAAVVVFAGLAVTVKMESLRQENKITSLSGKVDAAETRLSVVEGVNDAQKEIIEGLASQRSLDGQSIVRLMDKYQELTFSDRKLRNQLNDLEKNDEARNFLDAAVPDSVGCLWDDSCIAPSSGQTADSPGGTTGGNVTPLLLTPKKEARHQP